MNGKFARRANVPQGDGQAIAGLVGLARGNNPSMISCKRGSKRIRNSHEYLLREGIVAMRGGDIETGKTILHDQIKATVRLHGR